MIGRHEAGCEGTIARGAPRCPTTLSYSPVHDHKRMPGRFHARLRFHALLAGD
jgi:hypothetical protein